MKKVFLVVSLLLGLAACNREDEVITLGIEGRYEGYILNEGTGHSDRVELTVENLGQGKIQVVSKTTIDSKTLSFVAIQISQEDCCLKFNLDSNNAGDSGPRGLPVTQSCSENIVFTRAAKNALTFRIGWGQNIFSFLSI